jgi:hypothetical protein
MPNESIYQKRLPGYPKESVSGDSYLTEIMYVGIASDLRAASPNINSVWGEYPGIVTAASIEPLELTDYGVLTVNVERKFQAGDGGGGGGGGGGVARETTAEIRWVDVQRSLFEHPKFRIGGGGTYELTSEDVAAIKKWQEMDNVDYKKEYFYYKTDAESGETEALSTNAKMFARGIEQGIEHYVEKAPVAIFSTDYAGGPGPTASAGRKDTPSGVPNLPSGYEWIRDTDDSVKVGGQAAWRRSIQWIGAKKVLVDSQDIFWTAP